MAITLRAGLNLGALSAEDDTRFLDSCFVDTIDMQRIGEIYNPKSIVLGRTGAGKSALLLHLEKTQDNVVRINPDSLSLNYISNSTIISFFESLDIDLDVFYQLLWRHVLVIELLQLKKQLSDEKSSKSFIANLFATFNPNEKKKKALEYLFNYGTSFWSDTEHRVREVVHNIEKSLEDQLGFSVEAYKAKIASDLREKNSESVKQTTEVIHKAQKVVNGVQIQELNSVMDFLSEDVFNDNKEKYFIIIDDLDTGWVHDNLRFKLVRALIETLKKFRKINNLKIVIGLRADLLESVLTNTSSKGFQTEKYEDMMLRMKWSKDDLKSVADKRINFLFKDQYTNKSISFYDVFSPKVGVQDTFDYILDRTLHRPRDIITYLNECLEAATGNSAISQKAVRNAEGPYSAKRFRSIADEWREAYGNLEEALNCLRDVDVRFKENDVSDKILENLCIDVLAGDGYKDGVFFIECSTLNSGNSNYNRLRRKFLEIMYIVGAVGVKMRKGSPYEWSFRNEPVLNYGAINPETNFAIHPMLFRHLNKRADPTSLV